MNNSSKPKGICRRSLLKNVPMIAGVIISTNVATHSLFAQAKATHEAAKQKTDSNAQVANFSSCPIHARSWKTQSQRADGANSSQPSLPDAPQRLIREADARTARSSWGVGFGRRPKGTKSCPHSRPFCGGIVSFLAFRVDSGTTSFCFPTLLIPSSCP
jgi:hypothetical protein